VPKYRVTFEVGADETCWWEVDADNEDRAKAEAGLLFYNDAVWSHKYPNKLPPCTVALVHQPNQHGDSV
jgi:hypothetical protein